MGIGWSASEEPYALERWHSAQSDVRFDQAICGAALEFIAAHPVKSVAMSPGIIGCPHEEGLDYKRQSGSHRTVSRQGWADFVFALDDDEEFGTCSGGDVRELSDGPLCR